MKWKRGKITVTFTVKEIAELTELMDVVMLDRKLKTLRPNFKPRPMCQPRLASAIGCNTLSLLAKLSFHQRGWRFV